MAFQRWLEQLKSEAAQENEARGFVRAEIAKPLPVKVREWWEALPAQERRESYRMRELCERFGVSPNVLGPVLHDLGWQRRRHWGRGLFFHYWIPCSRAI